MADIGVKMIKRKHMIDKEKAEYLVNKAKFDLEEDTFSNWYRYNYEHTSLRKIRQAAFRKEMVRRTLRLQALSVPLVLFESLEKFEFRDFRDLSIE